jgi:DNA-binding IclR family transcriptional regulator
MAERAKGGSAAVDRVLTVLDGLASAGPEGVGARQLSIRLNMSRSSVHRLLSQLSSTGFVQTGPDGAFEVGPLGLAWASMLAPLHSLTWAAADIMQEVAAEFDEAVYLVTYAAGADHVVFVSVAHSEQPIRYTIDLPSTAPLHAGAAGKAVLAQLDESLVDGLTLVPVTERTQTDRVVLSDDLRLTRERGYAVSVGERIAEACGVAAPVFRDHEVVGALTITVPAYRSDPARTPDLGAAVSRSARRLSALISE